MEPACRPSRGALRPVALFAGWSAVRLLAGGLTWPPTLQAEEAGGVCAQPYTYYILRPARPHPVTTLSQRPRAPLPLLVSCSGDVAPRLFCRPTAYLTTSAALRTFS